MSRAKDGDAGRVNGYISGQCLASSLLSWSSLGTRMLESLAWHLYSYTAAAQLTAVTRPRADACNMSVMPPKLIVGSNFERQMFEFHFTCLFKLNCKSKSLWYFYCSLLVFIDSVCSCRISDWKLHRMAVPPSYADLGKAARDLFTKGFSKFCTSILKSKGGLRESQLMYRTA